MVISLERDADCLHMVQLMPLHSQTPSSFASFKSTLVLPFCYRLTQVVLDKRPLNGCSSLSVVCGAGSMYLSGVHLSVRPSVCLFIFPPHAVAAGLLLCARRAGDIDGLPCTSTAVGQQQPHAAAAACGCRLRAVPRCQLT